MSIEANTFDFIAFGMPKIVAGECSVVACIRCDAAALASVRRLLGSERPLLVRRGEQKPFVRHAVAA